ncbi:MAG: glycerol-3-phosphate acyltransferase 2 [Fimbriimonadales bacterium]|nr:MAG: glycerol-3-phosphate acyltransferase 2 [Fimbriimonadales bacterium]
MALNMALSLLIAYLIGGIPFGFLVGKLYGVDIRSVGSGNIGATNVWRTLGPVAGLAVLLLDIAKGYVPAEFAAAAFRMTNAGMPHADWPLVLGLAAILGHVASPFLRFRGGKAVATSLGVMIALTPVVAALSFGAFLACLLLSRYVSLSSLVGAMTAAVSVQWLSDSVSIRVVYVLVALLLVGRHRANLRRLARGEEPRFQFSKKKGKGEESR